MTGSLAAVAHSLGGTVVGHQVLCPGPGHSKQDRSLSVILSATHPDGFLVHSHCGDDALACKDYVRSRLGWERPAWERPNRSTQTAAPPPKTSFRPGLPIDEAAKIARARAIWEESLNLHGTLVEAYLASRSLVLNVEIEALRFHPACPWKDEATGQTIRVPAMVGAMRSLTTNEITGVHRTALTTSAKKIGRRMLGKASGASIMLSRYETVEKGLHIGEGIETCLAAAQLGFLPVWAMGSVSSIASFPVLGGVESLTILAETDDGGASERAIAVVGKRWEEAGREILVATPLCAGDMNDAIRRRVV